uniref:Protein orai-3 n=1 Tax=Macrostomum lignano TaxID=282301 RepID=A0A1I8HE67_9PLAT
MEDPAGFVTIETPKAAVGDLDFTGNQLSPQAPLGIKDALSWRRLQLRRAKLKAASRTSALLSGFAIVAMVELEIGQRPVPDWLLVAFACAASLLIAVHMLALMISTCILPNLGIATPMDARSIRESPHDKMRVFIEIAWVFSTGLGILLFLVVVVLLAWVKFLTVSRGAAIGATVIIAPVVLLFLVFSLLFYRQLTLHKFQRATKLVQRLQRDLKAFGDDPGVAEDVDDVVKVV